MPNPTPMDSNRSLEIIAYALKSISCEIAKIRILMEHDYVYRMNTQTKYSNQFEEIMKNARMQSDGEVPNS